MYGKVAMRFAPRGESHKENKQFFSGEQRIHLRIGRGGAKVIKKISDFK